MKDTIGIILVVFIFCLGVFIGRSTKQTEIENRAKKIKTETITQQQLEYIIFNEIQE